MSTSYPDTTDEYADVRDAWGERPPGDPDGSHWVHCNRVAYAHRHQEATGWEYRTVRGDGPPPRGSGPNDWELNNYVGVDGHGTAVYGRGQEPEPVTYWRRRTTLPPGHRRPRNR